MKQTSNAHDYSLAKKRHVMKNKETQTLQQYTFFISANVGAETCQALHVIVSNFVVDEPRVLEVRQEAHMLFDEPGGSCVT